jgi:hypothetical protein
MWITVVNIGWAVSALLVVWMVFDWFRIDTTYAEETLTSSREGEIEAASEKHKI